MGKFNSKGFLCDLIKNDDDAGASKILEKHPQYLSEPLNDSKDTPGLILASTYGSNKIIKLFLEKNCDTNIYKTTDRTTALMVAVKRNNFSTCLLLLENGADLNFKNDMGLTAFDYSVLFCNYEISLYFKEKFGSKIREIDYYLEQGNKIGAPFFNINLYIDSLNGNVPLDIIPQFKLTKQQNLDFNNKLPDPKETWHEFFNRIMKFKIYQPPLVEKDSIPLEKRNSVYVRMQTKLLEIEYEKKMSINDENKEGIQNKEDLENQVAIADKSPNKPSNIELLPFKTKNSQDHKEKRPQDEPEVLDEEKINFQNTAVDEIVEIPLNL